MNSIKIKYNPTSLDIVEIVKQIKQHIQLKNQELKIEDRLRLQLNEKLEKKLDALPFPNDVKEDLKKNKFNLIFDSEILFRSQRPKFGFLLSLTRKIFKPFLKIFINIDPLIHFLHRQSYLIKLYQEILLELMVKLEKNSQSGRQKKERRAQSAYSKKIGSKKSREERANDKRARY